MEVDSRSTPIYYYNCIVWTSVHNDHKFVKFLHFHDSALFILEQKSVPNIITAKCLTMTFMRKFHNNMHKVEHKRKRDAQEIGKVIRSHPEEFYLLQFHS